MRKLGKKWIEVFFSFNFALFRARNFTTSSILSRFISCPYFQVVLWKAIQPQTSPGFTPASLSVWGINSWQQDEFFRYSTLVMLLKVNSAVLLRMRLAHSYKILPWQFKVTLVSVLLPHEALGIWLPCIAFLILHFLSLNPGLWSTAGNRCFDVLPP